MDFHSDYYKLGEVREIMQDIYNLRHEAGELNKSIAKNKKIISAPKKYYFTPCTENYDVAMARESARVSVAEKNKRKRRMSGILFCSIVFQIAALIAMVIFMLPKISILIAEPLLFSIGLIFSCFLAQRAAMNDGRMHKIYTIASIILMVILLLTYGVLMLGGVIANMPNSPLNNPLIADLPYIDLLFELTPVPFIFGMAQALIGVIFTLFANHTAEKIHVALDYDLLQKAKDADDAENAKREQEAKRLFDNGVALSKKENLQFSKQIEYLNKQISEKENKIAAIGILSPAEYDYAGSYWSLIYNETLQTGRQVDVNWARWKYSQNEADRADRRIQEAIKAGERLNQTLTDAFNREEKRQAQADLVRGVEKLTEATEDLLKELDKYN